MKQTDKTGKEFCVVTATPSHHRYIPDILSAIHEASKVKGNSIVMRDPAYLAQKMDEGNAIIALNGETFAGFWKGCETYPHYPTLLDNKMKRCECHGLLFEP